MSRHLPRNRASHDRPLPQARLHAEGPAHDTGPVPHGAQADPGTLRQHRAGMPRPSSLTESVTHA
jgi:hypothetical protein